MMHNSTFSGLASKCFLKLCAESYAACHLQVKLQLLLNTEVVSASATASTPCTQQTLMMNTNIIGYFLTRFEYWGAELVYGPTL